MCVWIRNTVDQAQETYRALRKANSASGPGGQIAARGDAQNASGQIAGTMGSPTFSGAFFYNAGTITYSRIAGTRHKFCWSSGWYRVIRARVPLRREYGFRSGQSWKPGRLRLLS